MNGQNNPFNLPPELLKAIVDTDAYKKYLQSIGMTNPALDMNQGVNQSVNPVVDNADPVATITPSKQQMDKYYPDKAALAKAFSQGASDGINKDAMAKAFSQGVGNSIDDLNEEEEEAVPTPNPAMGGFQALLNNPLFGKGVNLDSSLYTLGRSIGYNDTIQNPTGSKRGKRGNILRGIGAAGKSLFGIAGQVAAGAGQQNMLNNFWEDYQKKMREGLISPKFQYGGNYALNVGRSKRGNNA